MDHLKTCSKCREVKPLDAFPRQKRGKGGLHSKCRPCKYAETLKWRTAHPERHREHARKGTAKITPKYIRAGHRYARALKYFQGRPGWTSIIYQSYLRAPGRNTMTWAVPALEEYISEFA